MNNPTGKTIVLTGKAVVNFRKVLTRCSEDDVAELMASNDLRECQIDDSDLLDIEWIHNEVEMKVTPWSSPLSTWPTSSTRGLGDNY